MVETNSREMIDSITEHKLQENLAWNQIRILRSDPALKNDWFERHMWDGGRIFLINEGGSHHFAAARYIAARLHQNVPLSGRLKTYRIDQVAAAALCSRFDMYAFARDGAYGEFVSAMSSFRAPFSVYRMPGPSAENQIVLLPTIDKRAVKVSATLRDHGFFDVNALITECLV
jgi:Family of unknown function (DUF6685)